MKKFAVAALMALSVTGNAFAATIAEHKPVADFLDVAVLLLTGWIIGVLGTLIGAGGGFLHVPMLIIFYDFTPQHAIGTSMTIVFLNALSGTFSYMKQKRIDYEIGLKFSVASVPGVFIGAMMSRSFEIVSFSIIFGMLVCLLSYYLFSGKELYIVRLNALEQPGTRYLTDAFGQTYTYGPDLAVGLAASFFVGVFAGLFGIGGGIIHVPLMYSVLGVPVHIATATSHFILTITSFLGIITFMGLKFIDMDYAVLIGIGTILGAHAGAKLSLRTPPLIIKKAIAVCLFLLAIRLISGALNKLT